jgi:fimbrial chaperone protein
MIANRLPSRLKHALRACQLTMAALCFVAAPVLAGSFQASPTRLQMTLRERATSLHLANTGQETLVLHAEVMRWTQDMQGKDVLEPSNDLVLSPPVVTLAPGMQQVVRLARLTPPDTQSPPSYRLIVREVASATDAPQAAAGQVPFLLAMSLPVFISPAHPVRRWSCVAASPGTQLVVDCTNEGNVFARVLRMALGDPARPLARFSGATYVLPGARQRFVLQAEPGGAATAQTLTLWFDDGSSTTMAIAMP